MMFDKDFQKEYIEARKSEYEKSGPVFHKKNGRPIAMLKDDWINFETEMMAWAYHEYYLTEVIEDNLCLSGGDFNDETYYAKTVKVLAEHLRAEEWEWEIGEALKEMSAPFAIILKTVFEAISFEEIAKSFVCEYRKTNS